VSNEKESSSSSDIERERKKKKEEEFRRTVEYCVCCFARHAMREKKDVYLIPRIAAARASGRKMRENTSSEREIDANRQRKAVARLSLFVFSHFGALSSPCS
jgi:hypothetical protein